MPFLDMAAVSVIIFVLVLIILLYIDRKNIERSGIIFYRRTDLFLLWIDKLAKKFSRFWRLYSSLGIIVFVLSMLYVLYFLITGLINAFLRPNALPTLAVVLPSVSTFKIGAAYLLIPFWYWIISIFLIVLVHEFSHGIVMRRENFKIKSIGLLLFGFIPGAFVEPEGEKMLPEGKFKSKVKMRGKSWDKGNWLEKIRVLSVGTFANILLGLIMLLGFLALTENVQGEIEIRGSYDHLGVKILSVENNSAASDAGLEKGMIITEINGERVKGVQDFLNKISKLKPGDYLNITTNEGVFELRVGKRNISAINFTYRPSLKDRLLLILHKNGFDMRERFKTGDDLLDFFMWRWVNENAYDMPELKEKAEKSLAELEEKIALPFIGVRVENVKKAKIDEGKIGILNALADFMKFAAMLNIGVGVANSLPIKPLDGGHFVEEVSKKLFKKKHRPFFLSLSFLAALLILSNFLFALINNIA